MKIEVCGCDCEYQDQAAATANQPTNQLMKKIGEKCEYFFLGYNICSTNLFFQFIFFDKF